MKKFRWTLEIYGAIKVVTMTENQFDYFYGNFEEGFNFWIVSKEIDELNKQGA